MPAIKFIVCATSTGLLLAAAFLFNSVGFLAFVAFAPLFWLAVRLGLLGAYFLGFCAGCISYACANYWVYSFLLELTGVIGLSVGLFVAYIIYSAQMMALLSMFVWLILGLKLGFFSVIGLTMSSLILFEAYQNLFEFSLATTQVGFPLMLLPTQIFGHWGLAGLIIFVNVLISVRVHEFIHVGFKRRVKQCAAVLCPVAIWLILAGWLKWSYTHNVDDFTPVKVGVVQTNIRPYLLGKSEGNNHTQGYPSMIDQAQRLAGKGAKLIVYPESSRQNLLANPRVFAAHSDHAQRLGVDLLMHDSDQLNSSGGLKPFVNRSLYFSKNGESYHYQKVNRIPFGEYIPKAIHWLPFSASIDSAFTSLNNKVVAGITHSVFSADDWHILPLVCFDVLNSRFVASALQNNPEANLIVLQSNGRWFNSPYQSAMHNAYGIVRAVEFGRPLIHVNNGGKSYSVSELGDIGAHTAFGRQGLYLFDVAMPQYRKPYITFASKHPSWLLHVAKLFMLGASLFVLVSFGLCLVSNLANRKS